MQEDVIALFQKGHRLFKANRIHEAQAAFEEGLKQEPDNPYCLTGMGDIHRKLKNAKKALEFYRRVLDQNPKNLFALRGAGDVYRDLERHEEAILHWKRYLNHRSRDVFVLTRVANSYKMLNRKDESEKYFLQALRIAPRDSFALLGLADLYHKAERIDDAITYYEKVLDAGAELINVLTMVGNLYWQRNQTERARDYFERALKLEPLNPYALYGLGNYYRYHNDYHHTIDLWEKILIHGSGTVNMRSRLGDAYKNIGQFEKAERTYRSILGQGYDKYAMIGLIKLCCLLDRNDEACDLFRQMLCEEHHDPRYIPDLIGQLKANCGEARMSTIYRDILDDPHVFAEAKERLRNLLASLGEETAMQGRDEES